MPKAEKNSLAALGVYYNRSKNTVRKWCLYISLNYKRLAEERKDERYLSWEQYEPGQKILTPLQYEIFIVHYGENDNSNIKV